ncbi:hypothetical protein [Paenibacillus sp. Marseille-Q9583]
MDVLNTYGGETDGFLIVLAVILAALALLFLICVLLTDEPMFFLPMIVCALFALAAWSSASEPLTHEVTLRPGGVIDAVKYEIIEQRGAIYVIEEREVTQ